MTQFDRLLRVPINVYRPDLFRCVAIFATRMIIVFIPHRPFVPENEDVDPSFSETELEVIRYLIEHPEMSHRDIAEDRGVARGTVNNAVARIRDKTRTALSTLLESPHTEEVAQEVDNEGLERLLSELQQAQDRG